MLCTIWNKTYFKDGVDCDAQVCRYTTLENVVNTLENIEYDSSEILLFVEYEIKCTVGRYVVQC